MKRLYVLISNKLEPVYGCVQGGHAVAQYLLDHKDDEDSWKNEYLIYLYVPHIKWLKWKLKTRGISYSAFYEPDLGGQLTALAVRDDSGEMFKDLQLVH